MSTVMAFYKNEQFEFFEVKLINYSLQNQYPLLVRKIYETK